MKINNISTRDVTFSFDPYGNENHQKFYLVSKYFPFSWHYIRVVPNFEIW